MRSGGVSAAIAWPGGGCARLAVFGAELGRGCARFRFFGRGGGRSGALVPGLKREGRGGGKEGQVTLCHWDGMDVRVRESERSDCLILHCFCRDGLGYDIHG